MVPVRRLRGEKRRGWVKMVALLNTSLPKQHTYSRLGRAAHPFLRGRRGSGHADRPRGARGSVQGTLHVEFLETAVARTESGQNLPRIVQKEAQMEEWAEFSIQFMIQTCIHFSTTHFPLRRAAPHIFPHAARERCGYMHGGYVWEVTYGKCGCKWFNNPFCSRRAFRSLASDALAGARVTHTHTR